MFIYKEAIGPLRLLKRTVSCFGKAKPLRQHRPSRVTSCPTDLDTIRYINPCTRLAKLKSLALPKHLTVLLSKHKGPMASSSTNIF